MTRSLLICTVLASFATVGLQGSFAADTTDSTTTTTTTTDRDAARQATADRRAEARRDADARRETARQDRESAREAQRSRKDSASGKRASNDSMETQRLTAQAMDDKMRGATDESKLRPPTTDPSDSAGSSSSSSSISSTDVDKQLRTEEARHAKAMESLNADLADAKSAHDRAGTKAAQAAIEKEMTAYKKRKADLEQQRRPAIAAPSKTRTAASTTPERKSDKTAADASREYKPE